MARICLFNSTPFWGGGEKWHHRAACALRDRGHEVVVVGCPGSVLLERARRDGIEVAEYAVTNRSWLNPIVMWRLRRFFSDLRPDVVIFNGPADIKAGGMAARSAGVPRRVYRRGLARPIRDHALNRYLFTRVLTHLIPNSEETRRSLFSELGPVVPEERVQVITNGIDLVEFDARPRRPLLGDPACVTVGTVGRLTAQKNQRFLLDVARLLVDRGVPFRMFLAGSGDLEEELRMRVDGLDLGDHVAFLGFVEDVASFLDAIDIFAFSSLWEGFSNVILEAGAAGKPIVALDTSSISEGVIDGVSAFLVEAGDVEAFADRLERLVSDAALRRRMGRAARADVSERFSFARRIDELERFILG
jgi:glycosyltransferase involved in cell wall biosynthesis